MQRMDRHHWNTSRVREPLSDRNLYVFLLGDIPIDEPVRWRLFYLEGKWGMR